LYGTNTPNSFFSNALNGGLYPPVEQDARHALCVSPNIILVISSRRMIWAEHVARMVEMFIKCCWGNLMARVQLAELGSDGRIILKWFFKTWDGELD